MTRLAIIGGTGLSQLPGLTIVEQHSIESPYGKPSAPILCGEYQGKKAYFLARHGNPHNIPPHQINYRANIWALKNLGITHIIAVAAVGGLSKAMAPAQLAIPDQIIDYTYGRKHTFFEDDLEHVTHIDFSFPYSSELRKQLIDAAQSHTIPLNNTGTYACTQGPRLETAAEIKRLQRDGCDLVGMTGMPEAALAKELDMDYAALAVVANWGAGMTENEITMAEIEIHLKNGMANASKILLTIIASFR